MKKIKNLIVASFIAANAFAQQPPTPNPASDPSTGLPGPQKGTVAWYRGGNSITTPAGTANIFGTLWNSPVYHFTNGKRRLTAFDDTYSTALFGPINSTPFGGGLAIHLNPLSPIPSPKSLLTIGEDFDPMGEASSGWRQWMRVGTFNTDGSDFAYFGLKREQSLDRNDAVIAWGDDAGLINNPNIFSPDYLRFIFSSDVGLGTNVPNGQGSHGLEVARFSPFGSFGIGNYYNNPIESPFTQNPSRRIEILSDKTAATNNGNPLLRLTHTQQDPINLTTTGLYSELEPRNNGDLFISVRDNTQTNTTTKVLKERFTGLNTNTPGNTFEINSQFVNSTTLNGFAPTATGWAGLRFTDLNSNSVAQTNPGTSVLSVDANGDVILVPGGGNVNANNGLSTNGPTVGFIHLGQNVAAAGNPGRLLNDREIPLNTKNLYFTGQDNIGQSALYVGFTGGSLNRAKVNVLNTEVNFNISTAGVLGINRSFYNNPPIPGIYAAGIEGVSDLLHTQVRMNNIGGKFSAEKWYPIGVMGSATDNQSSAPSIGVFGKANSLLGSNIGGTFNASSGTNRNFGVQGRANSGGIDNTGVEGIATGTGVGPSYGGAFSATGGSVNYGVYSFVLGLGGGSSGGPDFAGYFNGDVFTSSNTYYTSDKDLKKDIQNINSPLERVMKLKPSYFQYDVDKGNLINLNLPVGFNYGFIAQDLEQVFPELVINNNSVPLFDSNGVVITPSSTFKSVNYNGMIGIVTGAVQELNKKQNETQATLDKIGLSDAQVKTNVTAFNALATVKTLSPVKYNFTNANVPQLSFKPNTDYGFIAQQLETVYPELVDTVRVEATYDSLGVVVNATKVLKTVNYKAMSALLVRSIQEQQLTIDSLRNAHTKQDSINQLVQQQLAALASQINTCCANTTSRNTNTTIDQLDIELSDKDAIVLNQNVPNPFAEQTTITFNVPASVVKAQLIFYNTNGQVIQTVDIKTRGKGKVNVFAADLSTGLYHYTLVADGKVADSKKMVRE